MSGLPVIKPRTRRDLVRLLLLIVMVGMIGIVVVRRIFVHPLSPKERQQEQQRKKDADQIPGRPEDFANQQQERLRKAEEDRQHELAAAAKAASAAAASAPKGAAVPAGGVGRVGNNPLPAGYQVPPTAPSVAADSARLQEASDKNPYANVSLAAYEASSEDGQAAKTGLPSSITDALANMVPKGGSGNTAEEPWATAIKGLANSVQPSNAATAQNANGVGPKNTQWLASEDKKDGATAAPLTATRLGSPYTLLETGTIPVVALTGFDSSLPAESKAMVTDDVYDNVPGGGTHRLIRKGSILALHPNTDIVRGQDRMMMAFTRIILYGGATVNLGAMSGSDDQGVGGIPAETNSHLIRRFGAATLLAGVSTLAQRADSSGVDVNVGSSLTSSSETALSQLMQAVLGDAVNIQDTLTIKPGTRMTVTVNKDLLLPPEITGNAP